MFCIENSVQIQIFHVWTYEKCHDWIFQHFCHRGRRMIQSWSFYCEHAARIYSLLCRMKQREEAEVCHHLQKPLLYTTINMDFVGVLYLNCTLSWNVTCVNNPFENCSDIVDNEHKHILTSKLHSKFSSMQLTRKKIAELKKYFSNSSSWSRWYPHDYRWETCHFAFLEVTLV
jgi:hypothetical protein